GRDVWVRQGRYRAKAPVTPVLVLRDGIEVYGGFAGGETYRAARDVLSRATVLDGDFEGDDADVPAVDANFPEGNPAARRADNSDHVVYGAEGARLDGFRIEHGHAGSGTFEGGGGLLALSPNLTLSHVDFVENSSTGLGGAILCAEYCDLTVEAARFSANRAANGGGLLAWPKSSLGPRFVDLTNVEFSDNWALEAGGGLYLRNNDPTAIRGLTCLRNEVDVYFGGCLYSQDTRVSVDDSEIAHNRAVRGAGAYGWRSTLSLTNSEINDNVASYLGGGFVSEGSDARIVGCRFVNDRATYGGAIALHATTRFELEHSEIVDNVAEIGAGLYSDLSGVRLYGVRMSGGQARDGGAMAIFSSSMTVSNGSFVANTAEEMGGAVYLTGATLEFRSGAFLRNHARFGGGIFAHPNVGYEVVDVVLAGNTAEWSGAGIYQAASVDGTLSRALFAGNNANHGIGLMMLGPGTLRSERVAFVANRGMNGGGLRVDAQNEPGCDVSLRDATFARNDANEAGAGFAAVNSAAVTLANATFSENVTFGRGGAIETQDADLLAINVAFWANRARSGAAVANRTARGTRLVQASFLDNDAHEGVVYNEGSSSSELRNSVFFAARAAQSELVDLGAPSVAEFVAARHLLPGTGNAVLAADPFELAPGARLFLNQALAAPPSALDAGSTAVAEDPESGFTALAETPWTELTTAADGRFDTGTVDLGRHYEPAAATILSFEARSTSFAWSTASVDSCFLFNVAEESIASLAPNELASGTRWHTSSSATEFALICFGPVGEPTVAFATVP
ncbi:MAG TPA: right-handed parallel beta-helix repeat-containing protein, partial [Polyangiaceae bacterium]